MSYEGALAAAKMQAIGQAHAYPVEPARDPGLIEIGRVTDHQRERLLDLLGWLTLFNDRVLGAVPTNEQAVGSPPVPSGLVDEIQQKQAWASNLIDALMAQAERLDRIG